MRPVVAASTLFIAFSAQPSFFTGNDLLEMINGDDTKRSMAYGYIMGSFDAGDQVAGWEATFSFRIDINNKVTLGVSNNTLFSRWSKAGVATDGPSLPYLAASMQYLRIRETAGAVFWEYSADGVAYTVLHTAPDPLVLTNITLIVSAGQTTATAAVNTALFDNINIP